MFPPLKQKVCFSSSILVLWLDLDRKKDTDFHWKVLISAGEFAGSFKKLDFPHGMNS